VSLFGYRGGWGGWSGNERWHVRGGKAVRTLPRPRVTGDGTGWSRFRKSGGSQRRV
jgi:hypothetical protein